jgi:hypothetical protein
METLKNEESNYNCNILTKRRDYMEMKGQGAIEYLLIIAAAILVVAIIILAVTGALGGGGENIDAAQLAQQMAQAEQMCKVNCDISLSSLSALPENSTCFSLGMYDNQDPPVLCPDPEA